MCFELGTLCVKVHVSINHVPFPPEINGRKQYVIFIHSVGTNLISKGKSISDCILSCTRGTSMILWLECLALMLLLS